MGWIPPTPTGDEKQTYFPDTIAPPANGTFELALTLGGTVSAGAYTAGVLDFLFEALDAWKRDPTAPHHNTVLKVVSGTSGGAVCAAAASVLTGYDFPHVHDVAEANAHGAQNPLFDLWVNTLDIAPMLGTGDILDGRPLPSLLNVKPINDGVAALQNYDGPRVKSRRSWLDATLSTLLTFTNLRGVPYSMSLRDGKEYFVNHADFGRIQFATTVGGVAAKRPDSFISDNTPGASRDDVAACAVASGAFPVGFISRSIQRAMEHYVYRVEIVTNDQGVSEVEWQEPDWDSMKDPISGALPDHWAFTCYDGGIIDNEPIALARSALTGMVAHTPRNGVDTKRALILIDPFADKAELGPSATDGMISTLVPFLRGMIGQGRYDTADLKLAADPNTYSRFMLSARRTTESGAMISGGKAIASAGLSAFQGFLSRDFRVHDFLIGRYNAYQFLKGHLTLPTNNPLFNGWSQEQRQKYAVGAELPIIPIVSSVREPDQPRWPSGVFDPHNLKPQIADRVAAVVGALENEALYPSWLERAYLWPAVKIADGDATDKIIAVMKSSLQEWGL